jgi:hypothetical protein
MKNHFLFSALLFVLIFSSAALQCQTLTYRLILGNRWF